ncbi:fibronectin type III domain-containing protein [Porphyromonas gulae]|uniref:Peptidase n=1 Tax=Porphyromonas gulae TaxID=111105 RepID=A0A0A2FC69_9PORP|nr:hypothetical protein [Porphyromonas gulae]KGN88603.1 peptidase [Porphyromonas gulae]
MKQNYFKRVCSLLCLVVPMLILPLQSAAQDAIPSEEAESLAFVVPAEDVEIGESEVEAPLEAASAEEIVDQAVRSYTYTVYRDGVKIASGLTEPTFVDEDVPAGDHTYCVEVQYEEGVSDKVCVDVEVKDFKPVTNLTGTASNDEVTLDWDGVEEKAEEPAKEKAVSYNVYKNGTLIGNTVETHYVETGVANGTYIYEVEVKYPDGVSPKVAVTVTVTNSSLNNVEGQVPYTLRVEGKKIIAETNGVITLYDISGRTVAVASDRLEYTAQTGFYAVRFDVGNKPHLSKIQVR